MPQLKIFLPSDFEDFKSINPLEKIDDLCDHLVEQIRGQGQSSRMDSKICQLQADINYLEKQLVQSKIKLAQSKAELDVSAHQFTSLIRFLENLERRLREIETGSSRCTNNE